MLSRSVSLQSKPIHCQCVVNRVARRSSSLSKLPERAGNNHHDIQSFLKYAEGVGLSPSSSVYTGTHYEYTAQATLRGHGFVLQRLGGSNDYGIDLAGFWHVPTLPEPLKVIVQCKNSIRKLLPKMVRELEGGFTGAPPGWRGEGVLAALVSPLPTTKGVRDAMARSYNPILWLTMASDGTNDGQGAIKQILWNRAATDLGLEGLKVVTKYGEDLSKQPNASIEWEGKSVNKFKFEDVKKEGT
ncbi:MAG: hypothetical protein Q9227_001531 [Pyrenula ochraceoflavens]